MIMPLIFRPLMPCDFGYFTLYIAPGELLRKAVADLLIRYRGNILYIQGMSRTIIHQDQIKKNHITLKSPEHAEDLLTIIKTEPGSLTIIEHDGSLYDSHADQVISICQACNQRTRTHGTVLLISPRPDVWTKRMESQVHRFVCHDTHYSYNSSSIAQGNPTSGQRILTGW
jgi:hypothetical protein